MTRAEEALIIQQVLGGDIEAFEPLVLENQKKVYNLALRMTGSRDDAFDISQDVFIKAYGSLKTFRGDCALSVWLYRMTSNLCIDFLRRESKRKKTSLVLVDDEGEEREMEIPDLRHLPESELEREELRRAIDEALTTLSPEHREIIVMREINGMSYSEISQALSLEVGTVKSRLARARVRLIKSLQSSGNIFDGRTSKRAKGGESDG